MHVILKPFIKIAIWVIIFLGIAELAGIDVEELMDNLSGLLGDALESGEGEEAETGE